ncbi:hypothetical protein N7470_006789 [Penicillium chermesinum]|nr:hypothetical protein N7470_006789 [Penicillium chermesinum]
MAFRGERFVLDLDEPDGGEEPAPSPFSLIGEIRERAPTAAPPAPAPQPTASSTGFPAHRKRKVSSFKQRRTGQSTEPPDSHSQADTSPPTVQDDKRAIEEENRRHLASMSDSQIQQEREELMASLDPGLLERFLRRARIDEDEQVEYAPKPEPAREQPATAKPQKSVSFDVPATDSAPPKSTAPVFAPKQTPQSTKPPARDDLPPKQPPADLFPAAQPPSSTQP